MSVVVHEENTLDYKIIVAKQPNAKWYNLYRYAWWVYKNDIKSHAVKTGSSYFKNGSIQAARGWIFDEEWSNVPSNLRERID